MKPSPSLRSFLLGSALLGVPSLQAIDYYWDNDGDTVGFGTAGGIWSNPTLGQWSTGATGELVPGDVTTTTSDALNFGNGASGLAAGTITVSGTVNSGNMTFASGSGAITLSGGTIDFADASTITIDNSSNTISSALGGLATSLTKDGTGTLVLSGGGSYAGNLRIAAGTLQLGANNGLSTNAGLNIAAGAPSSATFDLNGYDQTLSQLAFTDTDSAGNLTITGGANSTLTINTTQNTELGPGGSLTATRNVTADMSGLGGFVWNGAANVFRVGPGSGASQTGSFNPGTFTTLLAGDNTITASSILVGERPLNNNGGTSVLRLGQSNVLNANTINIGASGRSNATLDFRDGLSGTPTVTIRGTDGTSAVTSWDVGRVAHFNSTPWAATVDFSAGELDALVNTLRIGIANTSSQTLREGIQNGTFSMGQGTLGVTTLTIGEYSGGGSVDNPYTANGTFNLNHMDGVVSADAVILANNIGTATSHTSGSPSRTVTGTFNLNAGTLEAKTLSRGTQTGNANTVTPNFNFTSGTVRNAAGDDLEISNVPINLTGSGTRIFEATPGQSITLASTAPINGTDKGFTKAGDGTMILSSNGGYTGATVINAGILQIGDGISPSNGTLGSHSDTSVAGGATLRISRVLGTGAQAYAYAGTLSGSGSVEITPGSRFDFTANQASSGNLSFVVDGILGIRTGGADLVTAVHLGELSGSGNVQRGGNTGGGATVFIGGKNTDSAFSGNISSAELSVDKVGSGTLILSGNTAYLGATTITAGTLQIGDGGTTGALGNTSGVTNNAALIYNRSNNFSVGYAIGGTGTLEKQGAGVMTLTNTNTYTGATTVNDGTLVIDTGGSTHASSMVSVNNADTQLIVNGTVNGSLIANSSTILSGTGTVEGAATVSGILNPGNSAGVLGFGSSLAMANSTAATMEILGLNMIRGTDYDGINVAGALTYDGALTLAFATTFDVGTYSFNLFDFGSQSGDFDSISLDGLYAGTLTHTSGVWGLTSGSETWTFQQSSGELNLTVIPEPRAALLGGLGLLMLLRRRRG